MDGVNGFLGGLTALLVALTGLLPVLRKLWLRDNATDDRLEEVRSEQARRLDLLWEAHMLRGTVEVKTKRLATEVWTGDDAKKLLLRPDITAAYEPIAPALRALRRGMPDATPGQLGEAIEARFGHWLAHHICEVIGVNEYACLVMALTVAETPERPDAAAAAPPA